MKMNFLDRAIAYVSPQAALARTRARNRMAAGVAARNLYDAASVGSRSGGWRRVSGDANSEIGPAQVNLRSVARGLLQNNAYAVKGQRLITDNVIGSGIEWKVTNVRGDDHAGAAKVREHLLSTDIDADGIHNIYGLQGLAMDTVVASGSALLRLRLRRPEDGYRLPFQIQVIEPDYIDTGKEGQLKGGNFVIQGVEFDWLGKRVAYWLFDQHPGSVGALYGSKFESKRVSADYVQQIFRVERPGQVHGVTWFAPVVVRMQDLMDYTDAQLLRQKIAACFAAFVTTDDDFEGDDDGLSVTGQPLEALEPGIIERLRRGESVTFGNPPTTQDFPSYHKATVREIAVGLGVPYESLAGDLEGVNYTSGRMGRIDFYRSVARTQWQMFIPQFCGAVERWTRQSFMVTGPCDPMSWEWTPPAPELMDPDTEIGAAVKKIRSGLSSRQEEARRLGYDVKVIDKAIAEDNLRADTLDLVFDTDPRKRTVNGVATNKINPALPADDGDANGDPTNVQAQ